MTCLYVFFPSWAQLMFNNWSVITELETTEPQLQWLAFGMHFRWWAFHYTELSRKTAIRPRLHIHVSGKIMGHKKQKYSSPQKIIWSIWISFFLIPIFWMLPIGHMEQKDRWLQTCILLPFAHLEGFMMGSLRHAAVLTGWPRPTFWHQFCSVHGNPLLFP